MLKLRRPGAAAAMGLAALAVADTAQSFDCPAANGPDIVCGSVGGFHKWGTVGSITGYSIEFVACNVGSEPLSWSGPSAEHPVCTSNLYRLKNGRFEQIGMSWVKHVNSAGTAVYCCPTCINPQDSHLLGAGCSDAY